MKGDTLTLEQSQPEFVWLVLATASGTTRVALYLPRGFALDDARAALLATGHVEQSGQELRRRSDLPPGELGALVEEMLGYFRAPGLASEQLLTVIAAVNEYEQAIAAAAIPLLAYAWLDIVVRDDLADQARSASNVWQQCKLELDCQAVCERRVDELCARFAPPAGDIARLAPSMPTRQRRAPNERTG